MYQKSPIVSVWSFTAMMFHCLSMSPSISPEVHTSPEYIDTHNTMDRKTLLKVLLLITLKGARTKIMVGSWYSARPQAKSVERPLKPFLRIEKAHRVTRKWFTIPRLWAAGDIIESGLNINTSCKSLECSCPSMSSACIRTVRPSRKKRKALM